MNTGKDKIDGRLAAILLIVLSASALIAIAILLSPPPCAGCNAKVALVFSPHAQDDVVTFIRSAKKTIDIEMYVFTSEDIVRELGEAEARGVSVRVILEPRVEDSRKEQIYALLSELGVDVRYASMGFKLTHSKFVIVDGKKALVGSINFSKSALNDNREAAVEIEGASVTEIASVFEEDWEKSNSA